MAVAVLLLIVSAWMDDAGFAISVSDPVRFAKRRNAIEFATKLDLLQEIERLTYDWRSLLAARFAPPASDALGFVFINGETIRDIGRGETLRLTPYGLLWPRYIYARVLRELHAQGAKAIAFDVFFEDIRHDHSQLPIDPSGTNTVDSDLFFAGQIRAATNATVILASLSNSIPAIPFRANRAMMGDAFSLRDNDGIARRIRVFQDYVMPSKSLEIFAIQNEYRVVRFVPEVVLEDYGSLELSTNRPSADGHVSLIDREGKRVDVDPVERQRVWHLGLVLTARVLGIDLTRSEVTPDRLRLWTTNGTEVSVPIDRHGRMYVDWTLKVRNRQLLEQPFEGVLQSDVAREFGVTEDVQTNWAGKYVLIGSVALGNNMTDIGPTPLNSRDFLVGTYLNIANSIIQRRAVHRWGLGAEVMLVIAVGLISTVANLRLTTGKATWVILGAGVVYTAIAFGVFIHNRLWLPVAHPIGGGLLLTHASLLTYRAFFEQRERQRVKAVFSKLVSPNVVHELLKMEHFALEGERGQLSVFFADVRGFTEMTDRRQAAAEEYVRAHGLEGEAAEAYYEQEAHEVLQTVNRYLAAIADVVKVHHGTLDKYIGDCVMAFWGAPTPNPRHAVDAVQAAIDAQRAIHALNLDRGREDQARQEVNRQRVKEGLPPLPPVEQLSLGTGINTGTMMVGLMGSEAHTFNYTVFGREVNLASRLEGVSGRARIIIGETTYRELLKHAPELASLCVMRDSVQVKGFREPVTIYEVLWRMEAAERTTKVKMPGRS